MTKECQFFYSQFRSNLHVSVGAVDSENNPTVTPIGSLFLNDDQTGFYFEKFASKLPKHAKANPKVCILGVNGGRWFWVKALFQERFSTYPAVKLYGELGSLRKATEKETARLARRMRATKALKRHKDLLGKNKGTLICTDCDVLRGFYSKIYQLI